MTVVMTTRMLILVVDDASARTTIPKVPCTNVWACLNAPRTIFGGHL